MWSIVNFASETFCSNISWKGYLEILWTEVPFSQRILIFWCIQKELSYTNVTSQRLLLKQSRFDKIDRFFKLQYSFQWTSIIHIIPHKGLVAQWFEHWFERLWVRIPSLALFLAYRPNSKYKLASSTYNDL